MQKQIERQIMLFTEATGVAKRAEVIHGTLFVKFHNPEDKEWFRPVSYTHLTLPTKA